MNHAITIERDEGFGRYGRAKRTYHATCSCGWSDAWRPVVKAAAVEHGGEHLAAVAAGRAS